MPVQHKFLNTLFEQGFRTNNAILDVTPYEPEVMFLGTFNPNTPNDNYADFFYGRNWFWPALQNVFHHQGIVNMNRRMPANGVPVPPYTPTPNQILDLCIELRLTFGDLISSVLHANNPEYIIQENDNVMFNNQEFNLIKDQDLGALNALGQVQWNINNIIKFLENKKSIKQVYLTRNTVAPYTQHWNVLSDHDYGRKIEFVKIFTPSASGLSGAPRMCRLIHHWLFNVAINYGVIDHQLLIGRGIDPELFRFVENQ